MFDQDDLLSFYKADDESSDTSHAKSHENKK